MINKKYIIFDFDGTIADTVPVMLTLVEEMAKDIGYDKKITSEDLEWVRNHTLKEIPKRFGIPWIKIPLLLLKGQDRMNKQMFSIPPCKGILPALKKLKEKGYTLAILSSNRRDSIQEFILKHNLTPFFDFVHSELNIFGKDKALLSLLKQYKMPIEDSIYVGDEMRDIDACNTIKLDCISVTWGLNSKDALRKFGAKYIVDSPEQLVALLP
ncbi:MAG: HAD hydrolase-like protein [Candidatus Roizmanbacteria bacterium]|nr:HAD hydrolase-like protein [Candidatus Roizmanbacteria bacterium]